MSKLLISVDFDNTIAIVSKFPHINKIRRGAKKYITKLHSQGNIIIINTCRTDSDTRKDASLAKAFLIKNGIPFDYFNENAQGLIDYFDTDSRKISADVYIDDKGLWPFGFPGWRILYYLVKLKRVKHPLNKYL